MNNPFTLIDKPLQPVPEELKVKVMNDVATAKLLMEIAQLFSYDVANIVKTTMDKRKEK